MIWSRGEENESQAYISSSDQEYVIKTVALRGSPAHLVDRLILLEQFFLEATHNRRVNLSIARQLWDWESQ